MFLTVSVRFTVELLLALEHTAVCNCAATPAHNQTVPSPNCLWDQTTRRMACCCRGPEESGNNGPAGTPETAAGAPQNKAQCSALCEEPAGAPLWPRGLRQEPKTAVHTPSEGFHSSSQFKDETSPRVRGSIKFPLE